MANVIQHKRNSTPGTVPAATGVQQGELAINIGDGKLYTKNASNNIINLGVTSISGTNITPSSGNFANGLTVNGTDVSLSGHAHFSVQQAASIVTNVFNKTASTIPKFSAVYINGGQGDQPTIQLAIASSEGGSSRTYGITAEAITSMNTGTVIVVGALTGVNTDQFNPTAPTGDINGTSLYLSPTVSGGLTTTKPYAPNHLVYMATVVRTHQNEGVVEVRVQNGYELEEIHDVAVTGATNGQFLQYNSGSGLWIPSSSGNFTSLSVNNIGVSLSGHTHSSSDITNFNSSVSGLLPTISNSEDNRILTSTGTSTGINAESNLTFNGSSLIVNGDARVDNLQLDGNTLSSSSGNIIISPSGTGALQRDGGGNSRGQNAVDWQVARTSGTMVASGNHSVIGGGQNNRSSATGSVVSGGRNNVSSSLSSTVGGGRYNTSSNYYSAVGGGRGNTSSGDSGTVGGGYGNTSSGSHSTVGGGGNNTSSNSYSTVGGGSRNLAFSARSFVGAGQSNVTAGKVRRANDITSSTTTITVLNAIAADFDNTTANALQIRYRVGNAGSWNITVRTVSTATQSGANVTLVVTTNVGEASPNQWTNVTVVNTAETDASQGQVVGGGTNNISSGSNSTVSGGRYNTSSNSYSTVGGGSNNTSSGPNSTVSGGYGNTSSGSQSTVGGGYVNTSSGSYSTVGGGRGNTSSGDNSTVGGGRINTSSGYVSTVGGGRYNTSSNSYSTVGGGYSNISSGYGSTVGGGRGNTSSGDISTLAGGRGNTSSGTNSTVSGGRYNTSSNYYSTVGGGSNNTSSGYGSTVPGGFHAKTTRYGETSHAAGRFANDGDAQHTILIARRNTTNATANQVLFLDDSSVRLTLPAETTWAFTIKLSAYNDTDNQGGWWIFRGGIRRNAANDTALIGSLITESGTESSLSTANASVIADDTNEALEIRVTGVASKNIRWVAVVDISQVSYAVP